MLINQNPESNSNGGNSTPHLLIKRKCLGQVLAVRSRFPGSTHLFFYAAAIFALTSSAYSHTIHSHTCVFGGIVVTSSEEDRYRRIIIFSSQTSPGFHVEYVATYAHRRVRHVVEKHSTSLQFLNLELPCMHFYTQANRAKCQRPLRARVKELSIR